MKRYNPINISGYHISEAGASPLHEAAFTLANLIVYVEEVAKTGMDVDDVRAEARLLLRLPSRFLRGDRQIPRPEALLRQDHEGAIRREKAGIDAIALPLPDRGGFANQAAIYGQRRAHRHAGAFGGAGRRQSLHTNGYDEAFAIPTEEAMQLALRTQQVIAEETNVGQVVDPLGGSYYVETLTNEYEKRIFEIFEEIDARGGTIKLIEEGWFQKQIADFAYETALRKQSGDKPVIGVNRYGLEGANEKIEVHPYDPTTAERQIARTRRVRAERDEKQVKTLLMKLTEIAGDPDENIMTVTVDLVRAGATMGEIVEKLKTVWGVYRESPVF